MEQFDMQAPIVVFHVKDGMYGVQAENVIEMIKAPQLLQAPNVTPPVVGLMNQRNRIIPVVDLRVLFGMEPLEQEWEVLIETLQQREQDHINWINELESALRQQREFKLTTDPHQCAFGKWYDHFHTDNVSLSIVMDQFNIPHRHIHALGEHLTKLAGQGKLDEALRQLAKARANQFKDLIALFAKVRETIRMKLRSTVIVIETAQKHFALMVDRLQSVETLTESPMPLPETREMHLATYATHSFRRTNCETLGLLIDTDAIPCQAFTADAAKHAA